MYGVLLAGGTGSRLWPLTEHANKHTLPVYDRPMIFHPLRNLVCAGLRDIVVVTGGNHYTQIRDLLDTINRADKNTRHLLDLSENENLNLRYALQDKPAGIADALARAHCIVKDDSVAVVLADNIFEDDNVLTNAVRKFRKGAHIFLKEVKHEELYEKSKDGKLRAKYGMARLKTVGDGFEDDSITEIIEKPTKRKLPSPYAVTGAYLYDNSVFSIVNELRPSARGELEITDVNNAYVQAGNMEYSLVCGWWGDAGESIDGLFSVGELVKQKNLRMR